MKPTKNECLLKLTESKSIIYCDEMPESGNRGVTAYKTDRGFSTVND
jgi:hypothetical protein